MQSVELSGPAFVVRITYDAIADIPMNRSLVRVTKVEMRSYADIDLNCYVMGVIEVNGNKAVDLPLTGTRGCIVSMCNSFSQVRGWDEYDIPVDHGADGSAQIHVYANLFVYYNQQELDYGINAHVYPSLPPIPRVTELSAGNSTLGQPMTIRLTRASASFTDSVIWISGSMSGTVTGITTATELSWTPPLELATQQTQGTQVPVVLRVTTYQGGTQVGIRDFPISCLIPVTMVPTLQVQLLEKTGTMEHYNAFVQSVSRLEVQTETAGIYGSSIQSIQVCCGRLTGWGESVTFALDDSGSVAITVSVTDSRGRIACYKTTIQVQPYQKPRITIREAFRCDEQGESQPDGEWLKVVFDGEVDRAFTGEIHYYGCCSVHGGTERREMELTAYSGQCSVSGGSFLMSAGLDTAYDCQVIAQDDYNRVDSSAALVSVAYAMLDLCRSTKAVGIGMRARASGKLSIGMDTDMNERFIGNMADPTEGQDAATKAYVDRAINAIFDRVFPVGCIYTSVSERDPGTLFGGTWQRLKDSFLLAAGDAYAPGSTGGEAAHTLTAAEMPAHTHAALVTGYGDWDSMWIPNGYVFKFNSTVLENLPGGEAVIDNCSINNVNILGSGGGLAHNNMPPFLAVYVWKRVE